MTLVPRPEWYAVQPPTQVWPVGVPSTEARRALACLRDHYADSAYQVPPWSVIPFLGVREIDGQYEWCIPEEAGQLRGHDDVTTLKQYAAANLQIVLKRWMALPPDATGENPRGIYVTDLPDHGWLEICAMTFLPVEGEFVHNWLQVPRLIEKTGDHIHLEAMTSEAWGSL